MTLETVLTVLISSLASGGAVGVVAKIWLNHTFGVRLSEIEARQRMTEHEHQVRFTRYDEKVSSAIEGAYALVCEYSEAVTLVIADVAREKAQLDGEHGPKDPQGFLDEIAGRFGSHMQRHSIYLPKEISEKLISVRGALRDAFVEKAMDLRRQDWTGKSPILSSLYMGGALQGQVEEIMRELQDLIRDHLSRFTVSS